MLGENNKEIKALCQKVIDKLNIEEYKQFDTDSISPLFICMTPRSGSTFLSSLFIKNNIGHVCEHFRIVQGSLEKNIEKFKTTSFDDYVRNIITQNRNKNFIGVKMDWSQFIPVYYLGAYHHFFPNAKFVYLTRNDLLMQAISLYIADQTGYFHSTFHKNKVSTLDKDIFFSYEAITQRMERIIRTQASWEYFFAVEGISPLHITYEEINNNPELIFQQICKYASIPAPKNITTDTGFNVIRNKRNILLAKKFRDEYNKRLNVDMEELGYKNPKV